MRRDCIAYTTELEGNGIIALESSGESLETHNPVEFLDWLIGDLVVESKFNTFTDKHFYVTWDLDETLAPFLRLLGSAACKELAQNNEVFIRPYTLFYIPGKIFSFKHVGSRYRFNLYNLSQYYPDDADPTDVEEIAFYGNKLLEVLEDMSIDPVTLTSPAKIYERYFLDHLDLPSAFDMPVEAAMYAWYCSGKLWIEAHNIGYWQESYDYDLPSAFPTVAAQLLDYRHCDWTRVEGTPHIPGKPILYGYCRCQVQIKKSVMVSPIIYTDQAGNSFSPTGSWETYLTWRQIKFITRWQLGKVKILDGWFCTPGKDYHYTRPLEHVIERLLNQRDKGKFHSRIAKRMAVGIYGKFGEEHRDSYGKHVNPVYFAEISSQVSIKLAEFIYHYKVQPIHVSVDGVRTTTKIELPQDTTEAVEDAKAAREYFGGFRLSNTDPALVVSSGLIFTDIKQPKGLSLGNVLDMLIEHPRQSYYETLLERPVTLGQALERRLSDLGKTMPMVSSINLLMNRDRQFKPTPETGYQLLNRRWGSIPYRVSQVTNDCEDKED